MKRTTRYRVVVLTSCHKVASIQLYHYLLIQSLNDRDSDALNLEKRV